MEIFYYRLDLEINLWCFYDQHFVLKAPDITFKLHQPRMKEHFKGNSQLDNLQ